MKAKVCFIGLGVMGFPMAGHLADAGYEVTVFNRTTEKSQLWLKKYSGKAATTPAEAAKDCDFVMLCVGNDNDVLSVVKGESGVLNGMKAGATLIDHTTASAKLAQQLEKNCQEKNIDFLDAPVSGGQLGSEKGILTIMVGGESATFAKAKSLLNCYSQKAELIGPAGHGQLAKMVNQICIAGLLQGLSEAIYFGEKSGINMKKVMATIGKGAAGSWQMENRAETMIEGKFDFGFALKWMRKDLAFCLDEAEEKNIALPITQLVDKYYALLEKDGKDRWDTSALIENLRQNKI